MKDQSRRANIWKEKNQENREGWLRQISMSQNVEF